MTTTPVLAAIGVAAAGAVAAIWLIPKRQAARWARDGVRGRELADLENAARATLVQIVGGVALILTFAATWMQIADARRVSDRTLRLSELQQESERFSRAVDAIGSTRPALRLGGIFSLQQVGRDSVTNRAPIVQLMAAYLREHAPRDERDPRLTILLNPVICNALKPVQDAQAALDTILDLRAAEVAVDLSRVDLFGVRAARRDFRRIDLSASQLAGADLTGARFDGARLYGADLRGACLAGAIFGEAGLGGADLRQADLSGANLADVKFFSPSDLTGARVDKCTQLPWRKKVPRSCRVVAKARA